MVSPPHHLFSIAQAAAAVGCSTKTIRRAIDAGNLAAIYLSEKSIRVSYADLDHAVRRGHLPGHRPSPPMEGPTP